MCGVRKFRIGVQNVLYWFSKTTNREIFHKVSTIDEKRSRSILRESLSSVFFCQWKCVQALFFSFKSQLWAGFYWINAASEILLCGHGCRDIPPGQTCSDDGCSWNAWSFHCTLALGQARFRFSFTLFLCRKLTPSRGNRWSWILACETSDCGGLGRGATNSRLAFYSDPGKFFWFRYFKCANY